MYEPFLNREKQFLKANAELDNRFKEMDQTKIDGSDIAKPRLNVFGNGSRVQNQSAVKLTSHIIKQKRIETKCGVTPKSSDEVLKTNRSVLCETVNVSDEITDKPQKLKTSVPGAANAHSNQSETKVHSTVNSINKPLDHKDSSTVISQTSAATVTVSSSSDPTVKKNISSDGLIRFLKSKVAILKQELELSQQENVKNLRTYESSIESFKKTAAQTDLVINENETLKIQIDKMQKANNVYETVLKEKDADLANLNKEIGVLKKELKEVNRLHSNLEKRFLKSQDDLEHAKKNFNNSQDCERQQRAVNHQQRNFFEEQIKLLSKQRAGLISAYKKQLLLLDNFKRQNLCLEQAKLLQIAEKDFLKILDWNS